jgi:hypothetical protein
MDDKSFFLLLLCSALIVSFSDSTAYRRCDNKRQTSLDSYISTAGHQVSVQLPSMALAYKSSSPFRGVWFLIIQSILSAWALALILISWEDVLCHYALPARLSSDLSWGQATVHGLTGSEKIPSKVWRRPQTVPDSTIIEQQTAIHTLIDCVQTLPGLRSAASDYQWKSVYEVLHTSPWTDLEDAAIVLRPVDEAVGFGWTACAWRHCGALADWQEALAELDTLSGVLEPFEALFCLDIMERSVRDMLAEAPWAIATVTDRQVWQHLPAYEPHRTFEPPNDPDHPMDLQEAEEAWRLDEDYLKALQELRVDDDE